MPDEEVPTQENYPRIEWYVALVLVMSAVAANALVVSASRFVAELEFQYSLPIRQSSVPHLVGVYQEIYGWAWGFVGIALIAGVCVLRRHSVSQISIALYMVTVGIATLAWALLALIVFYLSNQSFAFTL